MRTANTFRTRWGGPWPAVVLSVACVLLGTSSVLVAGKPERPNFVIIMADDMGYGDSSVYDGWLKTPSMERMAREGLTFTDFHSSGVVCSPTRAGLVTGRYQQRAGIPGVINADPKEPAHWWALQHHEVTFAELLRDAGYRTAIFGKWHLGYDVRFNPTTQGFEVFRGFVSGNIDYISHYDRMGVYDWWHNREKVKEPGYLTHLITRHAVEFIREHRDEPFCLYVPHGAVHTPLQAPDSPPQRGPEGKAARAAGRTERRPREQIIRAMMKALDDSVGAILDTVVECGIQDRTLVWFFSDNGGARHMKNTPLRGGKGSEWEGGHRVPCIAWWPGKIRAGARTDELTCTLDVMPTMLELAGVDPPAERPLDGVSLVPLLLQGRSLGERRLYWNGVAMREGPWKLMLTGRDKNRKALLFDLRKDISEQHDVAAEHPDRVARMRRLLAEWEEDVARGATPQPPQPAGR